MLVYYKADIIISIIISLNVPCSCHDIVEKLLMFGVKKQFLTQKASCDNRMWLGMSNEFCEWSEEYGAMYILEKQLLLNWVKKYKNFVRSSYTQIEMEHDIHVYKTR